MVTELDIGLTFSRLALRSSDPAKIARSTANARAAYESAQRIREKLVLSPVDSMQAALKFRELAALLTKLKEQQPEWAG